jgi:hypothetical protein
VGRPENREESQEARHPFFEEAATILADANGLD